MGQWKNVTNPFPGVPRRAFQNVKTDCCCICRVSSRRSDMESLHVGEKLVSVKHAEDEPKLNDHVP